MEQTRVQERAADPPDMVPAAPPPKRSLWKRCRRFLMHSVLHADDPPSRLALGAAIAMFVTFTPTVGFQMVLVLFLAWLMGANKAIGVPIVWISNPATVVPIYWGCYHVGRMILRLEPIGREWWANLRHPPFEFWARVQFYWAKFWDIFWPVWMGGIVVGLVAAYPTYYAVYYLVRSYRLRRWGQLTPPRSEGAQAASPPVESSS